MKNSARFFNNAECPLFPCHRGIDSQSFNCLFCYCPLYPMENCGGNYTRTPNGAKDCSRCTLPHHAENYSYILEKLQ